MVFAYKINLFNPHAVRVILSNSFYIAVLANRGIDSAWYHGFHRCFDRSFLIEAFSSFCTIIAAVWFSLKIESRTCPLPPISGSPQPLMERIKLNDRRTCTAFILNVSIIRATTTLDIYAHVINKSEKETIEVLDSLF